MCGVTMILLTFLLAALESDEDRALFRVYWKTLKSFPWPKNFKIIGNILRKNIQKESEM